MPYKKIGITETYDPCFVPDWETKLLEANIVISKELNDEMIEKLLIVKNSVIFHHTVTGQGGSVLEPNVKPPDVEFAQFEKLLSRGFPLDHYVLRLDPIILLNSETQERVENVLNLWKWYAADYDNVHVRCRVSIVDLYPHARERLAAAGIDVFYDGFRAPPAVFARAAKIMEQYSEYFNFECCAEPGFAPYPFIKQMGCASQFDIFLLGLHEHDYGMPEKKQRGDCLCLAKKQILGVKPGRCPHGCLYCFWKDSVPSSIKEDA